MTVRDYLMQAEEICQREFISSTELADKLDISYNTLVRARQTPEKCSFKTVRKIKMFVEKWTQNNVRNTVNMSELH